MSFQITPEIFLRGPFCLKYLLKFNFSFENPSEIVDGGGCLDRPTPYGWMHPPSPCPALLHWVAMPHSLRHTLPCCQGFIYSYIPTFSRITAKPLTIY